MTNEQFYKYLDDPRGYFDEYPNPFQWRTHLRAYLYEARQKRSDLTQKPLTVGFQLFEGIIRRPLALAEYHLHLMNSGVNCLLVNPLERVKPSRTLCYWLSVVRYGKTRVDKWLDDLPFTDEVNISYPWQDTYGLEVVARIPEMYDVDESWHGWFDSVKGKLDCEG